MVMSRGVVALGLMVMLAGCGAKEAPPVAPAVAVATPDAPATDKAATAPAPKEAAAPSEAVTKVDALEVYDLAKLQQEIQKSGAKVTLVAVWATWCMPCIEEMPVLDAYYQQHRADGFRVVGLCTDDRADMADKIQSVLERSKVSYRMGLLTPGGEDAFFKGVDLEWDGQLPKGLVFDANGKKVDAFSQAITREALDAKIAPLLAK